MKMETLHAIRAAKNRYTWGLLPTLQYLAKRQVPFKLYSIARQLEAMTGTQGK